MPTLRALAAGLVVAATLGVGAATSVAAPTGPPSAAKPSAAAAPSATPGVASLDARRTRAQRIWGNRLLKANRQYVRIVRRVRSCPGAAPKLRTAARVRTVALRKWKRASARSLRAKNRRMRVAVLRAAKAGRTCGLTGSGAAGSPYVVTPGGGNVVTTPVPGSPGQPGQPGAPGAPGEPGAPGQPGDGSATSLTVELPVRTILDGLNIDLSAVLTTGVLPQVIQLVPHTELTSPVCTAVGTACIGINRTTLTNVLTSVTSGVPLVGGLLATVTAHLTGGTLSSVLKVQRVSDKVVRIVPVGPLATLRLLLGSLAGAPTTTVAILKTVH